MWIVLPSLEIEVVPCRLQVPDMFSAHVSSVFSLLIPLRSAHQPSVSYLP